MADGEYSATSKSCKYCRKSVGINNPKNVKCVNCESLYHSSCAQRVKTLIMVNEQDNLVKCCSPEIANVSVDIMSSPEEVLKTEVTYLKMLLNEKNARINELIKLNQLLEENRALINGENEKLKNYISMNVDNKSVSHLITGKKNDFDNISSDKAVQPRDLPVRATKSKNTDALISKQKTLMNELINVNHDKTDVDLNKPPTITTNIQDGFTEVTHNRRNRSNMPRTSVSRMKNIETKGIATVSETDVFRAKPSKMWLYVGKAMNTATETIVKDYIMNKCNSTDADKVEVYKLPLLGKSLAFQIGVDISLFDQVNCADFWPKGIVIRRFHFDFNKTKKDTTGKHNFLGNQSKGVER
ncbi:hypothetical protein WA026_021051 [Henosepilachna vigintioctopunctata]|uniref:Phorbol-ester/DAG-type domain-containing protein n=2 Tax=Henosepilachna vigintioctopunctata TaxID=420089 RepID=A0AAW1V351_9CUCU